MACCGNHKKHQTKETEKKQDLKAQIQESHGMKHDHGKDSQVKKGGHCC